MAAVGLDKFCRQNFEQNKRFLRALPVSRISHFMSRIYPSQNPSLGCRYCYQNGITWLSLWFLLSERRAEFFFIHHFRIATNTTQFFPKRLHKHCPSFFPLWTTVILPRNRRLYPFVLFFQYRSRVDTLENCFFQFFCYSRACECISFKTATKGKFCEVPILNCKNKTYKLCQVKEVY